MLWYECCNPGSLLDSLRLRHRRRRYLLRLKLFLACWKIQSRRHSHEFG